MIEYGITVFGGARRHVLRNATPSDALARLMIVFRAVCGVSVILDHHLTMTYPLCKRCSKGESE